MVKFIRPSEIDKRLDLPEGRTENLAKRGKIPAVCLPDGTIRIPEQEFNDWLSRQKPTAVAL